MTVLSSDLLLKVNLPKVNALSQTNPNTELLAAQLILSAGERSAVCRRSLSRVFLKM